ncbi:NUDIX hydrolase domain-like protein [Aspergillus californicus]
MSPEFNYTVAPHLEEYNVPFSTFRATRPEISYYIGGGLIFSRSATNTDSQGQGKEDLRILLLQRSYEDSYGGHWEGPGGSCEDEDQTLLDGVSREVFEESGLHVTRFVELVGVNEWTVLRPDRVHNAAKFTFIVEVHEAKPAVSDSGFGLGKLEETGLPADKLGDGVVVPGLSRRWDDAVKLDPAEHRAFEWASEEEIREGKFMSFGQQGMMVLKAFQIMNEQVQAGV